MSNNKIIILLSCTHLRILNLTCHEQDDMGDFFVAFVWLFFRSFGCCNVIAFLTLVLIKAPLVVC